MKTIIRSAALCIALFTTMHSFGWSMLGHRVTAEIASGYLSGKARKNIRAILGNESLAMASTWGDFIKSDPAYKYLDPWHYVNLKAGLSKEAVVQFLETDTMPNVYNKIHFLAKELRSGKLDMEKKKMYLRLLVHFVGDVHQPMHVGKAEDQGGNRIRLLWFNQPSNLHRVWDDQLIDYQNLSYSEYTKAINFCSKEKRKALQQQPISDWVYESYQISAILYNEVKSPEQNFSYNYNFDHVQTLNERLLKGGVRLAGILNNIFG